MVCIYLQIFRFLINNPSILHPLAVIMASIIAPSIALTGVFFTIKNSSENNRKSVIGSTITKERTAWINRLRDAFVEFNDAANQKMSLRTHFDGEKFINSREYHELIAIMQKSKLYCTLLLNPKETPPKILLEHMDRCIKMLPVIEMKSNFDEVYSNLEYLQQVILKAEWRRTNQEAENKIEDMEEIYDRVSQKINEELAIGLKLIK